MTAPKDIEGVLYFSKNEPCIIGHLTIGSVHYEIAGIRRSKTRTDITGSRRETVEHGKWADLGATRQAGIRCKEPTFWAYLNETTEFFVFDEETAAEAVRSICGVASRADLGRPGSSEQRLAWHKLDDAYQAWKVKEHA
jgi:hypothetical protein